MGLSPLDLISNLLLPLCVTLGKPLGFSESSIPTKERRNLPLRLAKANEVPGIQQMLCERCWIRGRLLFISVSSRERLSPVTCPREPASRVGQWPSLEVKWKGAAAGV